MKVNWCELTVTDGEEQVLCRNSFITDWRISADNVAGLATAGRARWRFFQHLEALTASLHVESWERLMDFRMRGLEIGPYAVHKK